MKQKNIPEQALIELTQSLVQIKSNSGNEEAIIAFIYDKMHQLGYEAVQIDAMGNVIGRVGNGSKTILFDAHVDTVDVPDESLWTVPPFSGAIVDDMLYGRGSVDMKSGAAAALYAGALAKSENLLEGKTIWVSCTIFEEDCDGENLKHLFSELHLKPDYYVTCEPSGNKIVTGHKGKAQIAIRTNGISAHGSAPEKGKNAVYEMAEIIERVEATNHRLSQKNGMKGTLVLSKISSVSASLNAVPSSCEIYLDRRMVPGETEATVKAEMDAIIAGKDAEWGVGTIERTSWKGFPIHYKPLHPAWETEKDHPLTQACIQAYERVFHRTPEYDYWDFSTNAVTPVSMGIPSIGFGPGAYKQAHMRDEHCSIHEIIDACRFYLTLIETL